MKKTRTLSLLSLRALRAALEPKVTQSQMARLVSARLPGDRTISPQRYWQIENGEGATPDPDEQKAVAAAIGVKVSEISWPSLEAKSA